MPKKKIEVRGHYRVLPNGKRIWIAPYVKKA